MKVISDTLKNRFGKYSRKSLTMLAAFLCCIAAWAADQFAGYECKEFFFYGFIGLAGGTGALTVWDKQKTHNEDTV